MCLIFEHSFVDLILLTSPSSTGKYKPTVHYSNDGNLRSVKAMLAALSRPASDPSIRTGP